MEGSGFSERDVAPAMLSADQSDRFAIALESLLAALRSPHLSDRAARTTALDVAVNSLLMLRERAETPPDLEPVSRAFSRLRDDLRMLSRHSKLDVEFVDPPANGRALPDLVAQTARAIVRSAVLVLLREEMTRRIRIQWDCDGLNLLVSVRDEGRGELHLHDDALRPILERITAVGGLLDVASTPGWGSVIDISIPLQQRTGTDPRLDASLSEREREVYRLIGAGRRNRDIAAELRVSENTVKFHVSNVLRKAGARSRGELIALSHRWSAANIAR